MVATYLKAQIRFWVLATKPRRAGVTYYLIMDCVGLVKLNIFAPKLG